MGWTGTFFFIPSLRRNRQSKKGRDCFLQLLIDWLSLRFSQVGAFWGHFFNLLWSSFYILHSPSDGWQAWQQDLMMILHLSLKNVAGYVCFNIYVFGFFLLTLFAASYSGPCDLTVYRRAPIRTTIFFPSVVVVCTEAPVGILTAGSCLLLVKNVGFKALFK